MLDTDQLSERDIADVIREVRQGDGLTVGSVQKWFAGKQPDIQITEGDARRLVTDLTAAITFVPNADQRGAVRNALGITWPRGETLTDRRMNYLSKVDISLRTLIRYEDAGALAAGQALKALWRGEIRIEDVDMDQLAGQLVAITRKLGAIEDGINDGSAARDLSDYETVRSALGALDAKLDGIVKKVDETNNLFARLMVILNRARPGLFREVLGQAQADPTVPTRAGIDRSQVG